MILIRVDAGARSHVELLGEGDVISPWVAGEQDLAIPSVLTATVMSPVRVALLDRRFAFRTARWPELHAALFQRLITRARRLSLQAAINGIYRVEDRVELTLWELAHRFGRVTREGLVVDLPITHAQLADLLAAQRPTVSLAIARLEARGRAMRLDRHRWLLHREPPAILSSLEDQTAVSAGAGSQPNLRPVTPRRAHRPPPAGTGRAASAR
jgi:CRP-like cAMP-binding protein